MSESDASLWSELLRFAFGGEPAANRAKRTCSIGPYDFEYVQQGLGAALVRSDYLSTLSRPVEQLRSAVEPAAEAEPDGLEGRAAVAQLLIGDRCPLTVRRYMRGGAVKHFSKEKFFLAPWKSLSAGRPFHELIVLGVLAEAGVSAVRPVVGAALRSRSGFFYRAYLATETVPESQNLFTLAHEVPDEFCERALDVGKEAAKMLRAGVLHVDLHPGNLLVCTDRSVVLLDFDRAKFIDPALDLADSTSFLARRWRRALQKHQLDKKAAEAFEAGLYEAAR